MQKIIITDYLTSLSIYGEISTLKDIENLIKKHLAEFPFTSIPVLLQEELSLELPQLHEKIIMQRRGGYCFEHNKLMYETLLSMGLDVKALFARVLNNRDIEVPKTHRFTLLMFENELYLVDVGFGFMSPSMPIKFGPTPTTTHLGVSYIIKEIADEKYALQIVLENGFYTLYSFDLESCSEADFEMSHFYSHKHPKANFVNNLVISRILEDKILSLRNSSYQKITLSSTQEIAIQSYEQLQMILESDFDYPTNIDEVKYLFSKFCVSSKI